MRRLTDAQLSTGEEPDPCDKRIQFLLNVCVETAKQMSRIFAVQLKCLSEAFNSLKTMRLNFFFFFPHTQESRGELTCLCQGKIKTVLLVAYIECVHRVVEKLLFYSFPPLNIQKNVVLLVNNNSLISQLFSPAPHQDAQRTSDGKIRFRESALSNIFQRTGLKNQRFFYAIT